MMLQGGQFMSQMDGIWNCFQFVVDQCRPICRHHEGSRPQPPKQQGGKCVNTLYKHVASSIWGPEGHICVLLGGKCGSGQ